MRHRSTPECKMREPLARFVGSRPRSGENSVIGVSVTFQYAEDFDHSRVVSIAETARGTFEGTPGLRSIPGTHTSSPAHELPRSHGLRAPLRRL